MKGKLKLDTAGIKRFFVEHGEKLVLGVAVLGFTSFVYSAITSETLPAENQPDRLTAECSAVEQAIASSSFDVKKIEGLPATAGTYVMRARREPLLATNYSLPNFFNPPLKDPKTKRDAPELYPVEELLASAGMGSFAVNGETDSPVVAAAPRPAPAARHAAPADEDEDGPVRPVHRPMVRPAGLDSQMAGVPVPAGSKLEVHPWVAIVGLVPVKKQTQEYQRKFEDAVGFSPDLDQPEYVLPVIERAEDPGNVSEDQLQWAPVDVKATMEFARRWATTAPEIVNSEYTDRNVTFPLGPLVGTDWPQSVAHPKVALISSGVGASSDPAAPAANPGDAAADSSDEDAGWGALFGTPEQPRRNSSQGTGAGLLHQPHAVRGAATQVAEIPGRTAEYLLFRFFDFNVEPGKNYRYRVQYRVKNPNHERFQQPERYLKSPDLAQDRYLLTPWSKPTPIVRVPRGDGVLAGPVKNKTQGEPTATVLLKKFDEESGLELMTDKEVGRGEKANATVKELVVEVPSQPGAIKELSDVAFESDALVLDIRGGQPLGLQNASETAPAELLFLDADGNLIARNELDDASVYERYESTKPTKQPEVDDKKGRDEEAPPARPGLFGHGGRDKQKSPRARAPSARSGRASRLSDDD